jgi:hypothetical protein
LFGYQAIGGTEIGNALDAFEVKCNIKNLFLDNDGFYCSSNLCDPCIVSGICYNEPTLDYHEDEEFTKVFNHVKDCSKKAGYKVLEEMLVIEDGD